MRLDETFAALADPTRRALLAHLEPGERTLSALAEPFPMSLTAIQKHVKGTRVSSRVASMGEAGT